MASPFANMLRASPAVRSLTVSALTKSTQRSFQTSRKMLDTTITTPRKPIGAFRGSLFGFLLGTVLAGGSLYYYVVDEYKISNRLLVEDIYALQSAVMRLENHIKASEDSVQKK